MAKKEFTATEVMALQEELRKGIQVIGEQYTDLSERFSKIEKKVDRLTEDMAIVKASLPLKANQSDLDSLARRVDTLETKVL